jgi:N-methylhydantoinase A
VLPQIKEYERVWTTVVNAYVGPALSRYLTNLAARLRGQGYKGEGLIMQSHGGVAPIRESGTTGRRRRALRSRGASRPAVTWRG